MDLTFRNVLEKLRDVNTKSIQNLRMGLKVEAQDNPKSHLLQTFFKVEDVDNKGYDFYYAS